ncbi:VWA domain-containing protein [Occallatibacter savannae]|uniref:VWA domain-containing protein n=1 Tax=Occallatibacter savannae TaxID=1002691 RepID=UPI000D697FCD|nr:VWA domain-containing protein [Occallatibacter savannae]
MTGILRSAYRKDMRYCGLNPRSAAQLGAGLILAIVCTAAFPQHPVLKTRSKEDREERSGVTHRITMNVQVMNASGDPVSDLRAEEFSLYDNHQPRRIIAFHPIDGQAQSDGTQVLILLDAVNTPAPELASEKNAIFNYLAESHKPLPAPTAFALWFNGHLSATSPTTDRNAIGRAFVKLTKNVHSNFCGADQPALQQNTSGSKKDSGATASNCRAVHFKDSIAALDGIAQQQLTSGGRTLLIWIGSGWPSLSNDDFERLDAKQREGYTHTFTELLHDLRAAQITMYSISSGPENQQDANAAGKAVAATSSANAEFPRIAVSEFAERTGGRSLRASTDMTADLRTCIRDAEWYYSIAFNAPPAQNGPGEMHSLEIKVDRSGLKVRTMNSYFTEPQ